MKLKDCFILEKIDDSFLVIPTDSTLLDIGAMITLNETAAFLWNCLADGADEDALCQKLLSEYEGVTKEDALADIKEFINVLNEKNILE